MTPKLMTPLLPVLCPARTEEEHGSQWPETGGTCRDGVGGESISKIGREEMGK